MRQKTRLKDGKTADLGNQRVKKMERIIPVCPHCGERYYTKGTHEKMQKIRKELEKGFTKDLRLIGHTYAYEELVA